VIFVVLLGAAAVVGGAPPRASASSSTINSYLAGHEAGLRAGVWLLGVGVVCLLCWSGALWKWMMDAGGGVTVPAVASLMGLVITGPLALTSSVVLAVAAARVDEAPGTAPFFFEIAALLLAVEGFGVAAHLAATNWLARRAGMLPGALRAVGALGAVLFAASAVLGASGVDVNGTVGLMAAVLWCVWICGSSYHIWDRTRHA